MSKRTSRAKGVAKASKPAEPWVPTLAELIDTIALHVDSIMTSKPMALDTVTIGMGVGGWEGTDCPQVLLLDVKIDREDTCHMADGTRRSRHFVRRTYAEMTAPVVAWVAAYWAARSSAPAATTAVA